MQLVPEIADARYDFDTGAFIDAEGTPITDEMFRRWVSSSDGVRKARAGSRTLKRGILINTLARAESGERPGLLERALRQSRQLVARGLKGTFYQEKRGSIVLPFGGLGEGQTVINLFENSTLASVLHESGHFFLEAFNALTTDPNAPQAMKDDMATILDWFSVTVTGRAFLTSSRAISLRSPGAASTTLSRASDGISATSAARLTLRLPSSTASTSSGARS